MIKANELRIGNLIYDDLKRVKNVCSLKNQIGVDLNIKLLPLSNDDFINEIMTVECEMKLLSYDVVEGIPLTEKWLEKLGFQNEGKRNKIIIGEYWTVGRFEISFCNPGFIYIANGYSTFYVENYKYVHQLQNLYFALTGEELTVKEMA